MACKKAVLFLFIFPALFLAGCWEEEIKKTDASDAAWPNTIYAFAHNTERLLKNQTAPNKTLSVEELQKYDLELPGTTHYKNSDQYSIFKDHEFLYKLSILRYETPKQASAHGEAFFTLSNSVKGFGTEKPDLLWVIKGLNEDVCDAFHQRHLKVGKNIDNLMLEPNLTVFPNVVSPEEITFIDTEMAKDGCLKSNEQHYYFYVVYPL